jgi:hypothetical protein
MRWGIAATAAGIVLLAGCAGGTPGATKTVTVTETVTHTPFQSSDETSSTVPTTTPPAGPATTITSDGTYLVGQDIAPGTYRSAGSVRPGQDCYWKRLASLNTSDIIDNNGSTGPQVVEILPSDKAFYTTRCQPWTRAG